MEEKENKDKTLIKVVLWTGIIAFLIAVIGYGLFHYSKDFISSKEKEEVDAWFYYVGAIGTAALAIIAYTQIKQLITTSSGEFLLHIDERWSSKEILEARTIIHKMYVNIEPFFDPMNEGKLCSECRKKQMIREDSLCNDCKEEKKCDRLALKILRMSASRESPQIAEEFIKILNYLDFMESIGYLWENKYVNTDKTKGQEQLNALCGASLIWNYNIFRKYIKYKRDKRDNKEYYKNFIKLCNTIAKAPEDPSLPYLKSKGKGA